MTIRQRIIEARRDFIVVAEEPTDRDEKMVSAITLYNLGPSHILTLDHCFSVTAKVEALGDQDVTARTVEVASAPKVIEPGKKYGLFSLGEFGRALRELERRTHGGGGLSEHGWRNVISGVESPIALVNVVTTEGAFRIEMWLAELDKLGAEVKRIGQRSTKIDYFTLTHVRVMPLE